jgi:hypothetical protein
LQVAPGGAAAAAAELAQLSSLVQLTELQLSYPSAGSIGTIEQFWQLLPLRLLSLHTMGATSYFLQQLTALQGLTSLSLELAFPIREERSAESVDPSDFRSAIASQLAAAIQQLTGLRHLHLSNSASWFPFLAPCSSSGDAIYADITALLRAIGGLQELGDVRFLWYMRGRMAAAEMWEVQRLVEELLPASLVPHCVVGESLVRICA